MASFASRGQQRTAILAFKLAELDLLTALDGRPPLLLLDDVFSELDPERRAHLVRRIAALPQAFVTTTTLDDLDPALRSVGTAWAVTVDGAGTSRLPADGPGTVDEAAVPEQPPARQDRRPAARGGAPAGARGRAPARPGDGDVGRLVAERVPPAVGACRLVRLEPDAIVVAADEPIVAAELRMRAIELLAASRAPRRRPGRTIAPPGGLGRPSGTGRSPRV